MARTGWAPLGLAAAMTFAGALATTSALAAPYKCTKVGGDFVFGQEANVNSLDQMTSTTISTRNLAMNMFEALMTRDESNNPITDLAESVTEAPDGLSYTFKLREGVKFHNGKPMTSADVAASWERYKRVATERNILDNVEKWETPDAGTFVVRMKKRQPTFIEFISSFSQPIVIIPAENKDDPAQQLKTVGTGPWQLVEFLPGSHVKMKRYEDYKPNTKYEQRTGFGGYKVACFDTVTARIVTEPGARVAGLRTGELHAVEDIPTTSVADLKKNPAVSILPLENWWIHITSANNSQPPTDNVKFRQAVQAVLDMDEIMEAATDGNYKLNVGFQYPHQASYTDAGKETYNQKNAAKAKALLAEAGYKGEPVVLLTNKDYPSMYNAALVMSQQMQAVGIKAELKVVDWPTSVQMQGQASPSPGWNFFFTGYGTQPALGALATMNFFMGTNPNYKPKPGQEDPVLKVEWENMNQKVDPKERQAAFVAMQRRILEQALVIPFGSLTKVQATRANVEGYKPFRIPRFSNVSFK
jgi:peptide/nickel transport system substrate-binding protein